MNRNNNNGKIRDEEKACCDFHPNQVVVGVCPFCLNERLLLLAAKQGRHRHRHRHRHNSSSSSSKPASSHNTILQSSSSSSVHRKKTASSSSIHKIFAFGGSLFTRQESQQQQHCKTQINYEYDASSSPEEDSFISIKFEENGIGSWEKNTKEKEKEKESNKSVIEHAKSRDMLRWRKRIGHIFHLMRWKRTGGVCHVGTKVEGVKVRKSNWMRTLTKRNKTME
ncbi:hypothetical protein PIB30_072478 [Stylosanthes scabra]|uniref:Uncharacterized protein n=1 Tax=Stylosanthes scabra TaxID=79078 RepID=A0ABU6RPX8_9FABA|nr:hypothetical protein [Stylosanthes scabra]